MSYTGFYSPIYPLVGEGEGILVTDAKGLTNFLKKELGDNWKKIVVVAELGEKTGEEPWVTHMKFMGVRNYSYELFNVSRLGYNYNRDEFIRFWSELSKYTEPFYFYHTDSNPSVFDIVEHRENRRIIGVECNNGKVTIKRFNLKLEEEKDEEE